MTAAKRNFKRSKKYFQKNKATKRLLEWKRQYYGLTKKVVQSENDLTQKG